MRGWRGAMDEEFVYQILQIFVLMAVAVAVAALLYLAFTSIKDARAAKRREREAAERHAHMKRPEKSGRGGSDGAHRR